MGKNGFTLIELLIVIAIVVILAGAMVPIINVTRQEARDAKARAELDSIKTASVMLNYDTGEWTPVGDAGVGLIESGGISGWEGPYLDAWANDPWGSPYEVFDSGTARYLQSLGADNAEAGTGYDADIELILTPSF